MRILNLTLENFGPYYETHQLELAVGPATPVVLIHGENMRGKTSLLNAIRWCLYGTTSDRHDRPIGSYRFISLDALEAADFHMAVTMRFEHDGKEYELERRVQSRRRPTSDLQLEPSATLKVGGYLVPTEEIPDVIAGILAPSVSRFFFFDGEMLGQYEVLLAEPGRDADIVRRSIDQILGLPAIQLGLEDLEYLRRDAERRQVRGLESDRRNDRLTAQFKQMQAGLEATEAEIGRLRALRATVVEEKDRISEQQRQYGEAQADLRELGELEHEIGDLKQQRKQALEECRSLLQLTWWLPLTVQLHARTDEIAAEVQRIQEAQAERSRVVGRSAEMRRTLESGKCATCGRALDQADVRAVTDARAALEQQIASDGAHLGDANLLLAEARSLQPFSSDAPLSRFADSEQRARRLQLDMNNRNRKIRVIQERLRGHERSEIAANELRFEQAVRQIAKLDEDIAGRDAEKVQFESQLALLQHEMKRLPGADPRAALEVGLYGALEQSFSGAVVHFRESLRREVEDQASEIFRQISTEAGYATLKINEQYGLSIVDERGLVIPERSAGAEQVVALSLIGGLNRCAIKEGPLVMDTPFGRLDVGHRQRILEFLPTLSTQVVLLVQSGEFDRDRDTKFLAGKIGREYRIVRDGTPTRSRFEVYR